MFIKMLFLLLTVVYNFHKTTAVYGEIELECENDTCTKCYKTLATQLLKNSDNYIALQNTFFSPDDSGPDFIIVTYIYDINSTHNSPQLNNSIWFWSSSAYFFYHPLRIFQYTSLGFSNPSLKQKNISLHLPVTCYSNNPRSDNMKLLTQRLKLFAMHQKITGQIDDSTYPAYSHSLETLKEWHSENSHISKLVLSSQVIAPLIAGGFLIIYFIYLIQYNPANLGEKLNSQANSNSPDERTAARSEVWIIVLISILFTSCIIIADYLASEQYNSHLQKEIKSYANDKSIAFAHLHEIPIIMMIFDVLSLLFLLTFPFFAVCYRKSSTGNYIQFSDFLYTVLAPLQCIATHSYHIIFAFINNPYHATSVLLFYIMTLFLAVIILRKIYFLVHTCIQQQCAQCFCILLFYIMASAAIAVFIALIVTVLIVIPNNNAIDQASKEIYAIYQASVAVVAALVTFVFFQHTNSIFTVFIKAADNKYSEDEEWKVKSEKEKEEYLGKAILTHIGFQPPGEQQLDD